MDNRRLTIAIADQDDKTRQALSSLFVRCNCFVCLSVDNGHALLRQIEEQGFVPNICIVDLNMPGMDGFQTTIFLKQKWPEIKVLATSRHNRTQDICKIIRIGADDFLPKDCTINELSITISSLYSAKNY